MSRCGMCGAHHPASAKFCSECGERLGGEKPAQRKLATILFCDVVGSTAMADRFDAESVREVMLKFFAAMRSVIEAHGGTTQKFIGDAVMAVFGVPVAREDDALRAVLAAAEMRERLVALNEELDDVYGVRLAVRMGINSGTVVAGEAIRDEALVLGDPVNVAARIEQAAPTGEVLLSEATRRLVRDSVEVEALPPISAKGKSEPLEVHRLVGLRSERRRARLDAVAIVDREGPLAELTAAVEALAGDPHPHLLVLVGDAGIGKTRLVTELESLVEATFLHGRCLPYGEGITYWPLAEVVRQAAGILEEDTADAALARLAEHQLEADDGPRVTAYLGRALGLDAGEALPEEIAWAARRFLEGHARSGPVVVCIDDLQWAEPHLLDLVESLRRAPSAAPILVLGMARPELQAMRPDWPVLRLDQLSEEDTGTLVSRLADLDDLTRSQLVERAGGSPLFVEELVVAVIEEPLGALPSTVEALLTARLDRFTRAERYVLERGAVEGLVFHRSAVQWLLAGKDGVDLDGTLQALAESGVVLLESQPPGVDPTYRFRHLLIRDAVYEGIPKRVRAQLHELLVEWSLAGHGGRPGEQEEVLAYHLGRAYECRAEIGVMDDHTHRLARSAADRLRSTARRAVARADLPAAVSQLSRAVAMLDCDLAAQLELLPELGEAHRLAGDPVAAERVLREAIERGNAEGNAAVSMVARVEEALLRLTSDTEVDADEATALATEAIAVFEASGDRVRLAKAWSLAGDTEWHRCRTAPMEASFLNALDCLARSDSPQAPAWILRLLALCYYAGPVPVDAAIERCRSLIDRAHGHAATEVAVWASVGALEAMRGDFASARDTFRRCRAIGEELELGPTLAGLPMLSGPAEALAGDLDAAERELEAGCLALEALGQTSVLSTAAALLARVLLRRGDADGADAWTATCERTASKDDLASQILWRGLRARLLADQGRSSEALRLAAEGVEIAGRTDLLVLHGEALLDHAEVLDAAGDARGAVAPRTRALALFTEKGHAVLAARTAAVLAADGDRRDG